MESRKALILGAALIAAIAFPLHSQAADTPAAAEVTYNSHVAEIINTNCVVCHRDGGIAPMQLTTFEQVRPWAPVISHKVATRVMPPYAYDEGIGIQHLLGDWRMEQDDIDTIVA